VPSILKRRCEFDHFGDLTIEGSICPDIAILDISKSRKKVKSLFSLEEAEHRPLDTFFGFEVFGNFFRNVENFFDISKIFSTFWKSWFSRLSNCHRWKFAYLDFWALLGRDLGYFDSFDNFTVDSKSGQNKDDALTLWICTFRGRDLSQWREENFLFMIWILTITFLSAFNPQTPSAIWPFWRSHDRRL